MRGWDADQVAPPLPQLPWSEAKSTSQPVMAIWSQSPYPIAHARMHLPPAHVAVAFGPDVQSASTMHSTPPDDELAEAPPPPLLLLLDACEELVWPPLPVVAPPAPPEPLP
jgi:hypothetical protein